jgi:hypothetical protein
LLPACFPPDRQSHPAGCAVFGSVAWAVAVGSAALPAPAFVGSSMIAWLVIAAAADRRCCLVSCSCSGSDTTCAQRHSGATREAARQQPASAWGVLSLFIAILRRPASTPTGATKALRPAQCPCFSLCAWHVH